MLEREVERVLGGLAHTRVCACVSGVPRQTRVCMCLGIGPLLRDTIRARGGVKSDKTPRGFTHRSGKPSQGGRQARRAPQSRAVKLRTYTGRHGSCRLRGGCMLIPLDMCAGNACRDYA